MLNSDFYHSTTRKLVSIFGNIFNEINISRYDKNNNKLKNISVPIHYGPKEKWVAILNQSIQDRKVAIQLPMMGFNISGFMFDSSRKISPLNQIVSSNINPSLRNTAWNTIPYKILFELNILTKYQDDACQIFEQIAPFFTATYTNRVKLFPGIEQEFDIPITMISSQFNEDYEGNFTERRRIIWTLGFEMQACFLGPISKQGVIKKIDLSFLSAKGTDEFPNVSDKNPDEKVIIMPGLTTDGKPTSDINSTIPYQEIESTDDYGFIEETYTYD